MKKYFQNLLAAIFGQPHISTGLKIVFYKDAAYFGEHGRINVSHKKHGLVEQDIAFVFIGVTTPPVLDLTTYIRVWEEARHQGYIPHHMVEYGKNNEVFDVNRIQDNVDVLSPNVIAARQHLQSVHVAQNAVTHAKATK